MTSTAARSSRHSSRARAWLFVAFVAALVMMFATVALAIPDEFGGGSFTAAYAPYTAGPVVAAQEPEPYAPYEAGPVIHDSDRAYAPYTAGPVVPEEKQPERIGNYLLR